MCRWLFSLVVCAGCVVNDAEPPPRGVVVNGPPPAPITEDRLPAPGNGSAWIAGYWHWTGLEYAWIPGHWEAPPPGTTWAAPQVSLRDGKYVYENGGWKTRSGNALR